MGLWSSIKNAVKGAARVISKGFIDLINRASLGLPDLVFGFLNWPPKKLRIKVLILNEGEQPEPEPVPFEDDVVVMTGPVVTVSDVTPSIDYAKRVLKERFNIKLISYGGPIVEVLPDGAPEAALNVGCQADALKDELGEAGDFFASNTVGEFGITIFIVKDVAGERGCSLGPVANYVTVDARGITANEKSTLVHELGHACGLWHRPQKSNLMYKRYNRGDKVKWWQKNIVRSARHVTYW